MTLELQNATLIQGQFYEKILNFRTEKTAKTHKKEEDDEKVPLLKSDPLEYQREMEEKKRIHKAREALSISMAKKRKEEQEEQDR